MQQDTIDALARLMTEMPAESRIDLILLLGDFYKEHAERRCPSLSREAMILNRRNFVVEILRRVCEFDSAMARAAAKKTKPDKSAKIYTFGQKESASKSAEAGLRAQGHDRIVSGTGRD
jgi:hypothetical protein